MRRQHNARARRRPALTFERFGALVRPLPAHWRLVAFHLLPPRLRDAAWADLADRSRSRW